ncbi:hypothetical protein GQ44DRAFT_758579 [Phaeosphaeriaceae sp. PMI808]|nr:hypothetical protein GQ44DRAFT_758579 [Phaeosphaeriaceae sp. PMI808]
MKDPSTTPWGASISNADLAKLKAGLTPQNQDNKWRIWVSDQNESGNLTITFARTAFCTELYKFHVKESDDGNIIESFTWEQNIGKFGLTQERATEQVLAICRRVMKCDMEALPETSDSFSWTGTARAPEKGAN